MTTDTLPGNDAYFLAGDSELAGLIRAFDWSATSLGPLAGWPQVLRVAMDILLHSPTPIVLLWGGEGVMLYNDAYSVFAGMRHPQLLGSRVLEGWPEVADFNRHVMEQGLAGKTLTYRDQHLILYRNNVAEPVWMDLTYSPVRDEAGTPTGVFAIVVETTQRILAERRRDEAERATRVATERLELALNAGAVLGTWMWDVPADLFSADERFARSFALDPGQAREGVALELVLDSIHPEDRDPITAQIQDTLRDGGAYRTEYRVRQADGSYRWVEANGHCELDGEGRAQRFPGVLIDIAARKTAQLELEQLNATLEQRVEERTAALRQTEDVLRQSQKMEAVGQLTGGIAHDFNNLLAGITGSLELVQLRMAQGRGGEIERYVAAARASANRAAALTHRLLAFSRRQTLDPKPVNLNKLVNSMEDMIRRTIGPAITLEVVAAGGIWTTLCDANQVENALLNLTINARDAMPGAGRLTIETCNTRLDDAYVKLQPDVAPGQYVALSVTDTGSGMPADVIARAFDPFYTTKPLGQGTGLGLSMVYGFVKQSGGHVRIYSEIGQGTTVKIYLPRHREGMETVAAHDQSHWPERTTGHRRTVLVVDDEPVVRMLMLDVIGELGFDAVDAASGPEALRVLQSEACIDLLVTDVGLPEGMNGRQLADTARHQRPGLKVLFVTGYAENAAVGNGLMDTGMEVMSKPFAMEALALKIADMLR